MICFGIALGSAALLWLSSGDEANLAEARRKFDEARQTELHVSMMQAVPLYEDCIAARGWPRLPWSNWRVVAHAHTNVANILTKIHTVDADAALQHASAALELQPDLREALWARADAFLLLGDYPSALKDFGKMDLLNGLGAPYLLTSPIGAPYPSSGNSLLPPVGPDNSNDVSSFARLEAWVRAHGGAFAPGLALATDVLRDGSRLRGIVVRDGVGLSRRHMLLRVPRVCTMTSTSLEMTTSEIALVTSTPAQVKSGRPSTASAQLALLLLREVSRGDLSHFAPYLAALPVTLYGMLSTWSQENLLELTGSGLLQRHNAAQRELQTLATNAKPVCSRLISHLDSDVDSPMLGTLRASLGSFCGDRAWQWAVGIVQSRAFTGDRSTSGQTIPILVPIMDMLNHRDGLPTAYSVRFDSAKRGLSESAVALFSPANFSAGQEVVLSYMNGAHDVGISQEHRGSAATMLMRYGFISNSIADVVLPTPSMLSLPLAEGIVQPTQARHIPSVIVRIKLLRQLGLPTGLSKPTREDQDTSSWPPQFLLQVLCAKRTNGLYNLPTLADCFADCVGN